MSADEEPMIPLKDPEPLDPAPHTKQESHRSAKHKRYYASHRDVLRQKAHERYFLKAHGLPASQAPPLRTNLRVLA